LAVPAGVMDRLARTALSRRHIEGVERHGRYRNPAQAGMQVVSASHKRFGAAAAKLRSTKSRAGRAA
jgi:hypothetical protein